VNQTRARETAGELYAFSFPGVGTLRVDRVARRGGSILPVRPAERRALEFGVAGTDALEDTVDGLEADGRRGRTRRPIVNLFAPVLGTQA
jgi:hypothetical protein